MQGSSSFVQRRMAKKRRSCEGIRASAVVLLALVIIQSLSLLGACSPETSSFRNGPRSFNNKGEFKISPRVKLYMNRDRPEVVMSNGLVQVTVSRPGGGVTGIKYKGIDNLLDYKNKVERRGYWDVIWNEPRDPTGSYDVLKATKFRVVKLDEDQVELSFTRKWNFSHRGSLVPLNVDMRYIMRRGVSGFYFYAIMEREEGWPDVYMDQIRAVFKLREDKFRYMALSDHKQKLMALNEDRVRGQTLDYREAVLLTNPTDQRLKGEVDDKYQYSSENKDNRVHGWISHNPRVGFWMITPSDEFRTCGPIKQELTSHAGPTVLSMFSSTHYAGREIDTYYAKGQPWKKVLGPAFVYLNSVSSHENPRALWEDAKQQMLREVESWPYDFPRSKDFPKSHQRGRVSGQLQVHDRYVNEKPMSAKSAYVGLAAPGDAGSWQAETRGYQFWTKTDEEGHFAIENVREGDYNLYAWVPGFVGDYKYGFNITVRAGSKINLGTVVFEPPRNGPTLWEIGVPDRSAAEFFVPDPYTKYKNPVFTGPSDKFRQYGLWERYADFYPKDDLLYTIGVSNYTRDWFFAHVNRKVGNNTFQPTTRQIIFQLEDVSNKGNYTLQLALSAATFSNLRVRLNFNSRQRNMRPLFSTGTIGRDNAIARHGIHGLYRFYSINVPSYLLNRGNNTIYLTQSRNNGPFQGVMYDYIRFEGPPNSNEGS